MKKVKTIMLLLTIGITSVLTMGNVHAASSYSSTLSLPYGTSFNGASRNFASGAHKFEVTVDGFNTSSGSVRKSGTSRMEIGLGDVSTGRILKYDTATYTYGTCMTRNLGTYGSGYRYYAFFSKLYNSSTGGYDKYDGVKSNDVKMYPKP